MALRVVHYTTERVENPNPRGETPMEEFFAVRGDLVEACRRFGPTGPEDRRLADAGGRGMRYWVVDDQYNDELYQYVDVLDPEGFSEGWLAAVGGVLRRRPGWGVGVGHLRDGYILIFGDRLMVTGPIFEDCRDQAAVLRAAARSVPDSDR